MINLTISKGTNDQANSFNVAFAGRNGDTQYVSCVLKRDYQKDGDGIYWGLNSGSCVKSSYTEADVAEQDRLASGDFDVKNGDHVIIEGSEYVASVNGRFSDAVVFSPAAN